MRSFVCVFVLLLLLLSGCSEAESFEELDSRIRRSEVFDEGGKFGIRVIWRSNDTSDYFETFGAGQVALSALRFATKHHAPVSWLELVVIVGTIDQYGNEDEESAFSLAFFGDTVTKANWSKLDVFQTLDLALPESHSRIGRQVLRGFCSAPDGLRGNLTFCKKVFRL